MPATYHTRIQRQPWLLALTRLHARGWCDREIAELLSDLSALAIAALEAANTWGWRAVEARLLPGSAVLAWTRQQAGYHRRLLGLAANAPRSQTATLSDHHLSVQREYQRVAGWFHLLPAYDAQTGLWLPGHELRRRESDILSLLRDNGPMTRKELAAAFRQPGHKAAVHPLHSRRYYYLPELERAGLIERDKELALAFRLAAPAGAQQKRRLKTGIERLAERIASPSPVDFPDNSEDFEE